MANLFDPKVMRAVHFLWRKGKKNGHIHISGNGAKPRNSQNAVKGIGFLFLEKKKNKT